MYGEWLESVYVPVTQGPITAREYVADGYLLVYRRELKLQPIVSLSCFCRINVLRDVIKDD